MLWDFSEKKVPNSCNFATKTHQIFKIFRSFLCNIKSTNYFPCCNILSDPELGIFAWKKGLMFRDSFQKTGPKMRHIPVCLNMWGPPPGNDAFNKLIMKSKLFGWCRGRNLICKIHRDVPPKWMEICKYGSHFDYPPPWKMQELGSKLLKIG